MTAGDAVEAVVETVAETVDVVDTGFQLASCFEVLPDCAIVDCDPGCL